MRLINTETLELEEFSGVPPRYAILSHTWGEGEVSLQDWQSVKKSKNWRPSVLHAPFSSKTQLRESKEALPIYSTPPADNSAFDEALSTFNAGTARSGYWKVLKASFQARADGLGYVWVDTSCIDKTSSAELSEAINSMYSWYRGADICYTYLVDVPLSPHETLCKPGSHFRNSRWFTRGWTLQELLAPGNMVFFSRDWTRLGTKSSLSWLLSEITHIEEKYLLKSEGIDGASIAQRMSWASNRVTTRPEDIAYCLLGIFDVNIPLIYGEGSKAFIRLQEEIIKISDDRSIFTWTWIPELTDPSMRGRQIGAFSTKQAAIDDLKARSRQNPYFPLMRLIALGENLLRTNPERPTMLAPDPIVFYDSRSLPVLIPTTDEAPYTAVNAGLSISLPLIKQGDGSLVFAVLYYQGDKGGSGDQETLICIPLARHTRQGHRYTRTYFPRGPIIIQRRSQLYQAYRPDNILFPDLPGRSATVMTPESIQVCRGVQEVPFYYDSFGGAAQQYGFWAFLPDGLRDFRCIDGYAPEGGVFNEYGIFFDTTWGPKDGQIVGGLLVFQNKIGKVIAVFLGRSAAGGNHIVSHLFAVSERVCDVYARVVVLKHSHAEAEGITWNSDKAGLLEQVYWDIQSTIDPSKESPIAAADDCKVALHNSASLSDHPLSDVIVAEISFGWDGV